MKEASVRFSSDRSVAGAGFREAFRYPSNAGSSTDLPYHLDLAHAKLIAELPQNASVLEIGCGGAQMRAYLKNRGVGYVGVDITAGERVSADLRSHGGPDLLCDAHFLPFPDGTFDCVYTSALVEHLASPFIMVQEVWRVLKDGGRFVGTVSFLEPWHDDSFFHMSPLGVFEILTQAGLVPEYIWPGRGYSGYNAMMVMGNKATAHALLLGRLATSIYRAGNRLRNIVRPRAGSSPIADDARISGSTDWIARKPAG